MAWTLALELKLPTLHGRQTGLPKGFEDPKPSVLSRLEVAEPVRLTLDEEDRLDALDNAARNPREVRRTDWAFIGLIAVCSAVLTALLVLVF